MSIETIHNLTDKEIFMIFLKSYNALTTAIIYIEKQESALKTPDEFRIKKLAR